MSSTSFFRPAFLSNLETFRRPMAAEVAIVGAASIFVALCAHISVPMPFTPVPTTMQPFAVILVGMFLGPISGCAAMILYLIEGASGLPVFTPQGPGGVAQLLGPTAGYLFSYPLTAAIAGALVRISRRLMPSFPSALLAGSLALVPVFTLGTLWLAIVLRLKVAAAFDLGVTPFLIAEALKVGAAAAVYTSFHTMRRAG